MTAVEIFKILSDTNRLRILNLLYEKELCVCELEYLLGVSQSNLSKHLRLMSDAGFVESRRENKFVYYRIKDEVLEKHSFLKNTFEIELKKEDYLTEELDKLNSYKKSAINCQNITALICEKAIS
ncbi:metalloregulator ArsR/SmtB family transcription factor [Acetobacterium paludosum]|uniref:Metalloregulator ArsR/SmtB family transcription factor n=1 Tax=Acetobacterium paludosum TaxID=52693 RepID=A0A923HV71_9FIRM|nr:metalloregulator ArsR/SmtB family transcription factor [Acetobacterium paludosum]MBC3887184.1 metalloregulator ArsR/SmtB family transcription factor [Acetobacterium paludosum]